MSRYHVVRDVSTLLDAARQWRDRCLINDTSVLSEQTLWTPELLNELDQAVIQTPLEGGDGYLVKLQQQLAGVSSEAVQLMTELHWVLFLLPDNIKPETKKSQIQTLWGLSQQPFDDAHPMLSDEVLSGAANAGTAFNTHRWRELAFLIQAVAAFKELSIEQRKHILSDAWRFSEWLASVPIEGRRQLAHILKWLLFPDQFERICTSSDKRALLEHFDKVPPKQLSAWSDLEIDRQLLSVRQRLEQEHGKDLDFYEPSWLEQWRPSPKSWLLAWNPKNWEWKSFQDDRLRVARGESVTIRWRTASKQPKEGDTAYLMRLGQQPKGLIARGTVASEPYEDDHYDHDKAKQGEKALYLDLTLTDLRDPDADPYVSLADLESETTDNQNWTPQGSGIEINPKSAKLVAAFWNKLGPVTIVQSAKPTPRQQAIHIDKPVNQIFYGPPGTGKTHHWRTHLQPKYESQGSSITTGEWLEEQLADSTWWEVVALALADLTERGSATTVSDLLIHPYFKAKARIQGRTNSPNLRQTCWGELQSHSIQESTTVKTAQEKRQSPLIFDKGADGQWILTGDWDEAGEDLRKHLKKLQQGPQNDETRIKRHLSVTFHQSYSYEDFVEGIRPKTTEGGISYDVHDGLFKAFCNRARQDPEQRYALFIDEINRGNISRVFGELITLIEVDKRGWWDQDGQLVDGMEVILPYSGDRFGVPKNLDIYATMNTSDRSIALMDAALRRRFHFIELMPEPKKITGNQGDGTIPDGDGGLLNLRELLASINLRIRYLLHRDQTFGHAYFMDVKDIDSLRNVMVFDIIPMLAEYFYDDWQQIRYVLADDGVSEEHQIVICEWLDPETLFASTGSDLPAKPDYRIRQPDDISPDALRKIYELPGPSE